MRESMAGSCVREKVKVPARSIQLPSRRWRETWWKRLRAEDGDSEMGWLAYAQDPAGNVFGLMEPDTNVK
jgi:hypothetical protein